MAYLIDQFLRDGSIPEPMPMADRLRTASGSSRKSWKPSYRCSALTSVGVRLAASAQHLLRER